jgi:hypothetical protein
MTHNTNSILIAVAVVFAVLIAACLSDGFGQMRDDAKSASVKISYIRTELSKAGK